MTAFEDVPETYARLDWSLLQNGFVTLYWRKDLLDEDLKCLRENSYTLTEFDAIEWNSESRLHVAFAAAFAFPSYYGCNLDALNDCLSDIPIPNSGGLVILIRNFDGFIAQNPSTSKALLGILNERCRVASLFGQRMIVLLNVRDPQFRIGVFGELTACWNPKEFLDSSREP
jgi:RNAse (barnase) inhibitor barstar